MFTRGDKLAENSKIFAYIFVHLKLFYFKLISFLICYVLVFDYHWHVVVIPSIRSLFCKCNFIAVFSWCCCYDVMSL